MRKEVLRIQDLSTEYNYRNNLSHITFQVYAGEAMGIVGLHDMGKTLLFDCLSGEAEFQGTFFFGEKRADPKELKRKKQILRIKATSSLVETMSVLENLMVIRRHRRLDTLIRWHQLRQQAQICMKEFRIDLDPGQKIFELSLEQRHEIEILKAYITGAKVILMDDVLFPYSPGDYTKLYQTMSRFQKKGISFVIAGCQLEKLRILTQRCLFLVNGKAIKMIENMHRHQIDGMKLLLGNEGKKEREEPFIPAIVTMPQVHHAEEKMEAPEMHPAVGKKERKQKENAAALLEIKNICTIEEQRIDLEIPPASVVVVLDLYQQLEKEFRKILDSAEFGKRQFILRGKPVSGRRNLRRRIYAHDLLNDNFLFPALNLRDNLCFTSFHRISALGFIHFQQAKVIERLFLERYKKVNGGEDFDWERLSYKEEMAVYLERILLKKWEVMFCFNMENVMSYELEPLMKAWLSEMQTTGRSICILASSIEKFASLADYFLIPREGKGLVKYTYKELQDFFRSPHQ